MSLNHRDLDYLYALNTYSLPVLPDLSTNAFSLLFWLLQLVFGNITLKFVYLTFYGIKYSC